MAADVPTLTLCGVTVPIKYLSLVVLVLQNSALFLMLRASRTTDGPLYIPGTAVVLSETGKLLASLLLIVVGEGSVSGALKRLHADTIGRPSVMLKLAVPAALYTLQNNLMFMAVTYLDAATFQVTYQLKILTTALFAVLLLGKRLTAMQWLSLVTLMLGVALIQMPESSEDEGPSELSEEELDHSFGERFVGLVMVIIACFSSGFAGVYFEKVLKGETAGVWVLNVQLASYGILIALTGVWFSDGDTIMEEGFFRGYTPTAFYAISLQAFGGLVVAVVVKYADNILKGFATSISIVISCVVSIYLFGFVVTQKFGLGTAMVIGATYMYAAFAVSSSHGKELPVITSKPSIVKS